LVVDAFATTTNAVAVQRPFKGIEEVFIIGFLLLVELVSNVKGPFNEERSWSGKGLWL
jgi:hypothetical protein